MIDLAAKEIQKQLDSLVIEYGVDPEYIFEGVKRGSVRSRSYSAMDLIKIAKNLHIDAVDLYKGNFCKKHISKAYLKDSEVITPDHLLNAAFSSTTSLNTILVEAEKFGRREYLLKKLQIDESYLDSHRPLSLFACRNALEIMKPFFTESVLKNLGIINAKKFCAGPFGVAMELSKSSTDALDLFVHHSQLIEKNWNYKVLSKNLTSFVLETQESELMTEHLQGNSFTTAEMNTWRWSFLEEVLRIKSGRKVNCFETHYNKGRSQVQVCFN